MKHAADVLIKPCLRVASVRLLQPRPVTNAGDCDLMGLVSDLQMPDTPEVIKTSAAVTVTRPSQLCTPDKSCLLPQAAVTADTSHGHKEGWVIQTIEALMSEYVRSGQSLEEALLKWFASLCQGVVS